MIIIVHNANKVIQVIDYDSNKIINYNGKNVIDTLFDISRSEEKIIGWCHESLFKSLNLEVWKDIFKHKRIMASFAVNKTINLSNKIGYVDLSPFINVKRDVLYPTWLMSTEVGGIYSDVLNKFQELKLYVNSFEELLCHIAKIGMPKGLLCYSNPYLLFNGQITRPKRSKTNYEELYRFVTIHYKKIWKTILFLNLLLFEKKLSFPFVKTNKQELLKIAKTISLSDVKVVSHKKEMHVMNYDVVIPTLKRKEYLEDVLKDLNTSTFLPNNVIIVEQNLEGVSELDDLLAKDWKFILKHQCISKLGACNARNVGLFQVTSDWIFLADDDIRFNSTLLERIKRSVEKYQVGAAILNLTKDLSIELQNNITQTTIFPSGASFINTDIIKNVEFDLAFENGYGEDIDFGRQIRNIGKDILYFPELYMDHLSAPYGGFREKIELPWKKETPKPSPTVMLYYLKHQTEKQRLGYKLMLFLKMLTLKNCILWPILLLKYNQNWKASVNWAIKLMQ